MKYKLSKEEQIDFIKTCKSSKNMSEACSKLNMHFNTFKKFAQMYGCYKPNQGNKGVSKKKLKIKTQDILDGKHPQFQTYKLKIRLIDEGYMKDECSKCGWAGKIDGAKYSNCELNHIDGNRFNHTLSNLELLCPNCHSLTKTYRARNICNEH